MSYDPELEEELRQKRCDQSAAWIIGGLIAMLIACIFLAGCTPEPTTHMGELGRGFNECYRQIVTPASTDAERAYAMEFCGNETCRK